MTWQWLVYLIEAFLVINILLLAFAYTTLLERKVLGRMQLRYGPNRAGPVRTAPADRRPDEARPQGSFFPRGRGAAVHRRAGVSAFTALLAFSVIPFGAGWEVHG